MSRTILFIILLTVHVSMVSAQRLKVTVQDGDSRGLPYAHLKINGTPVSATDTLGIGYIDVGLLKPGDTISASFLGTIPDSIIYDNKLQHSGECELILKESMIPIGEIAVYAGDAKKLFQKKAKMLPPMCYNSTLRADFNYCLFRSDNSGERNVNGSFVVDNQTWFGLPKDGYKKGWYHHPIAFTTSSDTLAVNGSLNYHMHLAFNVINSVLMWIKHDHNNVLSYAYLGKADNLDLFRISSPEVSATAYQILIYVDIDTKDIRRAEVSAVRRTPSPDGRSINEIIITTDLEKYVQKESLIIPMIPILKTKNLHYSAKYAAGNRVEITMSNERITIEKKNMIKYYRNESL